MITVSVTCAPDNFGSTIFVTHDNIQINSASTSVFRVVAKANIFRTSIFVTAGMFD